MTTPKKAKASALEVNPECAKAGKALTVFFRRTYKYYDYDDATTIRDMLAALKHYSMRQGVDFEKELESAMDYVQYEVETAKAA